MGLDEFKGKSGSSRGGGGGRRKTKVDFSRPYLIIAELPDDSVKVDRAVVRSLEPGDDPENDYKTLASWDTSLDWKWFKRKVKDEFGLDAEDVLELNPRLLPKIQSKLSNPGKPDLRRKCRVCGDKLRPDKRRFEELDIRLRGENSTTRVACCKDHTIEELAEAGLTR